MQATAVLMDRAEAALQGSGNCPAHYLPSDAAGHTRAATALVESGPAEGTPAIQGAALSGAGDHTPWPPWPAAGP